MDQSGQNLTIFLPKIAPKGFLKPPIVGRTIIDGIMYYISLESSFLVDSKNGIVFIFWSIFGHFINTFLKQND